jgi:multidrug resistance protein
MLSMAIFPLWWSSFSEEFGRRSIYLISFMLFVVFSILCAVSQNIAMLIVFRVLTGGASASVQAVGAGTIADIWESFERGRAMSMFYLGPLLGPILAPIIGGALSQSLGWRACMYFLAIYGLCVLVMLLLFLPETLAKRKDDTAADAQVLQRTSTRESAKVHSKRFAKGLKRFLIDPLAVLLFLRFPPVLITVCLAAIAFGALFVSNISIQQEFAKPPYEFKQIIVGLLYFPPGIGYFAASLFGGKWIDNIMAREARKANRYDEDGKLILLPEDRMRENMWIANTVYPVGLLLFGWTINYGIFWFVPSIGTFLFGISSMLVFVYTLRPTWPFQDRLVLTVTPQERRNDHAHRVCAQEKLGRRGGEQLCPQHPQLRGHHCRRAVDRCHWRGIRHDHGGVFLHRGRIYRHLGAAEERAQVAEGNGSRLEQLAVGDAWPFLQWAHIWGVFLSPRVFISMYMI